MSSGGQAFEVPPASVWLERCRLFSRTASAVVIAMGLFLFFAWLFDVEAVAKPRGDWTPTNPTTALAFVLAGLSLWWLRPLRAGRVRRRIAQTAASLVVLLGLLALVDFALGWTLRVDPLAPREHSLRAGDPFPFLTAPATAFCLILTGFALLLLDLRTRRGGWPAQTLAMLAGAVALLAAAGYYYGPEDLHRVTVYTTITIPSVLAILLLCGGLVLARPDRGFGATFTSPRMGGLLLRRLLPLAILVPLLVGWLRLLGERIGLYHFGFGLALFATSLILIFIGLIWWSAQELDRMDGARERAFEALLAANRQLSASEARFRLIVENVKDFAVFTTDLEGRVTTWNPGAEALFGYRAEEIEQQPAALLGPEPERDQLAATETQPRERWRVRKDGSRFYASESVRPLEDESGREHGLLAVVKDITAQKELEDELRRDMTFFRAVAETVPGLLFTWRADGSNLFACPNFYEMTGFPAGSAAGDGWLEAVHEEDRRATERAWRESLRSGQPFDVTHRLRTAGGGYRWMITRARAVRQPEEGSIVQWFGFSTDIEEQKRTEERLEALVDERTAELKERAAQLTHLASELTLTEQRERKRLAQVLHDNLQQLIVGARYGLDLLRRRLPESEGKLGQEVEELLNESIALSRSLTMELSPPILHDVGLAAGMDWLARWMGEKRGLKVDMLIDPNLVVEREDLRILVFEAVRELLLNVVRHAGVDRARVEILSRGEEELAVTVEDEGSGFDPAAVIGRSAAVNAGFGLFNLRERVGLAGGSVSIDSRPGAGSRIGFFLPLGAGARADHQEITDLPREPVETSRTTERGGEGRLRVMLADDHAVVRQGLSALLASQPDLEVVAEAEDGVVAVELARELTPDVILMDYSMPRLDGVRATRVIHGELPQICIIGLSMFEAEDRGKAMQEAGARAYLSKSGSSEELLATLRQQVERSAAA